MAAHRLGTERMIYAMSPLNLPALQVASGDTVVVETADCFENQVQSETQPFVAIDWEHVNPATGPIYVQDAAPGDLLAISIERIETADHGVMTTGPEMGVFGDELAESTIRIVPIVDRTVKLLDHAYPCRPMIGVIGTAPRESAVPNGTPGEHGGNMDCKLIGQGATLVLPVEVPGALLALGDLHAVMGDGEVCSTGVEMAGEVTLRLRVLKRGVTCPHPSSWTASRPPPSRHGPRWTRQPTRQRSRWPIGCSGRRRSASRRSPSC